jgi:hypothetical protein
MAVWKTFLRLREVETPVIKPTGKGKGKVLPLTCHEGTERERGIALLFH